MISMLLLALSLSLDSFTLGVAYGFKQIRIPLLSKTLICLLSVFFVTLSTGFGHMLGRFLPLWAGQLFSFVLLFGLGISMLRGAARDLHDTPSAKPQKTPKEYHFVWQVLGLSITIVHNPAMGDLNHSNTIDPKESLYIGLALSLDALSAGIGYGIYGFSWSFAWVCGLVQFLLLTLGGTCGQLVGGKTKNVERIISFLPGMILICLALLRLIKMF